MNVLPHVAVEGDGELTERAGEDSPFYPLRYKVFLFSTADRAGKERRVKGAAEDLSGTGTNSRICAIWRVPSF